jgi:hypothetical protein
MTQSITNDHNILRILSSEKTLRASVVLVFVFMIGVMLLIFPGRFFHKAAEPIRHSSEWTTQASSTDADRQTMELRHRAAAALALLKAKAARASNER